MQLNIKQSIALQSSQSKHCVTQLSQRWIASICLYLVTGSLSFAGEYHLGEGYTVGNINLAGYTNLIMEAPRDGKASFIVDDLSLFGSGRFNQYVNPFFELEISGATLWREGSALFADDHPHLKLERLYNDSKLSQNLTLRIGKMLTPIGEWNTIHAAPLVWTTTRPMTTRRSFSQYTSGLLLDYSSQSSKLPDIQVFWQPDDEFLPSSNNTRKREYIHTAGAHLNWASGLADKLGVSLQHADIQKTDESQTLLGLNFKKALGQIQLESEATYTAIDGHNPNRMRDNEWGAYVFGGYAVNDQWLAMARYEYFADRNTLQGSRNTLIGLNWRPDPALVWKLEYIKQDGAKLSIGTGLYASFSMLF